METLKPSELSSVIWTRVAEREASAIRATAEREQRSVSSVVRQLLRESLDRREGKAEA